MKVADVVELDDDPVVISTVSNDWVSHGSSLRLTCEKAIIENGGMLRSHSFHKQKG